MHIGIFGHYGNTNLGDEAIIEATIASVARHFNHPQISCFSPVPEDTIPRHGVPAYPIVRGKHGPAQSQSESAAAPIAAAPTSPASFKTRIKSSPLLRLPYRALALVVGFFRELRAEIPFLKSCLRNLKPVDLLIIAGSNQFLDNFGGVTGFPLTLLKWSILCQLTGTKLAFVSVGAGPINSRLSMVLIRTALLFADYLSFRDEASRQLVEGKTSRPKGKVYPDLASNLIFTPAEKIPGNRGKPQVAINPMPMFDSRYWCETNDDKYTTYVNKLAALATRLMQEDYPVYFFGTQRKDYNVVDDILPLLPAANGAADRSVLVRGASSVQELMTVISGADIVIATRFHGTVLSLVAGVPVLGICYYRKAADLLREMEQDKYFVLFEDFDVDVAYGKLKSLEENLEVEKKKIEQKSLEYRNRVEEQYAYLASRFTV